MVSGLLSLRQAYVVDVHSLVLVVVIMYTSRDCVSTE